jgi:exodeoxyribonuclease VII large subunit
MDDDALTVTELNNLIKEALRENLDSRIRVSGEISNLKTSRGHMYMTLKDKESMISVNIWSYEKYSITKTLNDGDKVIVTGSLNLYGKMGTYNLSAYNIVTDGVGDIHKDYIKHKNYYTELGYFDEIIKKPMPTKLNKIGVITAIGGAALKDFMYVLEKGRFKGKLFIKNASVQGATCPSSIASCIKEMDKMGFDVIVVTRGGGSLEDLIGFSHPDVIEALYKANSCTISAIGHEIDTMLSDYVADIRAPTPSVAGELLVKGQAEIFKPALYDSLIETCYNTISDRILEHTYRVASLESNIIDVEKAASNYLVKIMDSLNILQQRIKNNIITNINRCNTLDTVINRSNPENILKMGYSFIVDSSNNKIGTLEEYNKSIISGEKLKIIFIDGVQNL